MEGRRNSIARGLDKTEFPVQGKLESANGWSSQEKEVRNNRWHLRDWHGVVQEGFVMMLRKFTLFKRKEEAL